MKFDVNFKRKPFQGPRSYSYGDSYEKNVNKRHPNFTIRSSQPQRTSGVNESRKIMKKESLG